MSLDFNFFTIDKNEKPVSGKILISEPFLSDPFFKRTVVLMAEHTKKGTVGFILNKPTTINIKDLFENFPDFKSKVYVGGPMKPDVVHYIHTLGDALPESLKIFDNIYWGGDFEKLKELIRKGKVKESEIRFFIGYSGWDPGQLDQELEESSWLVSSIRSEIIFQQEKQDFWNKALGKLDQKYKLWSKFPQNPTDN